MELFAHHTPSHTFNSTLVFGSLIIIAIVVVAMYVVMKGARK